jgi:hypothetical protein
MVLKENNIHMSTGEPKYVAIDDDDDDEEKLKMIPIIVNVGK